jgi:hypothetical protein
MEEKKMGTSEAKKRELIGEIKKLKNIIQGLKENGRYGIEIENLLLNNLEDKEIDQLIAIIKKLLDLIKKLVNQPRTVPPENSPVTGEISTSINKGGGGRK